MKVNQSCPTLSNLMDRSPPGSSVHGILQARILEWIAFPFSKGSSKPRDRTLVSHTAGGFFTSWATREAQKVLLFKPYVILLTYPFLCLPCIYILDNEISLLCHWQRGHLAQVFFSLTSPTIIPGNVLAVCRKDLDRRMTDHMVIKSTYLPGGK